MQALYRIALGILGLGMFLMGLSAHLEGRVFYVKRAYGPAFPLAAVLVGLLVMYVAAFRFKRFNSRGR